MSRLDYGHHVPTYDGDLAAVMTALVDSGGVSVVHKLAVACNVSNHRASLAVHDAIHYGLASRLSRRKIRHNDDIAVTRKGSQWVRSHRVVR